jgi:hypothetical protein
LPDLNREPRKAIYTIVRLVRAAGLVKGFLLGQLNRQAEDRDSGKKSRGCGDVFGPCPFVMKIW